MKARSAVFTHMQYPDTIFGLPPKMVLISVGVAFVVFMLMFAIGLFVFSGALAFSLIVFAVVLAGGLSLSHRLGRSDRHVESLYLTSARFWRSSSRRWLLAGAAPDQRPLGGRS